MKPLVSVIILNYNGAEHLPSCLESLLAQTYPEVEIIIADNDSADNSFEISTPYLNERVRFARLGYNYGFGQGNNLGADHAHGEYLFFVNNDMRFAADLIETLVNVAKNIPDLFALDCKQYNWEGTQVIHGATQLCKGQLAASFQPYITWVQIDTNEMREVPFVNGANVFCRRDRFAALGGFDSTFFLDFEDVDLCWRAWLCGWSSWHIPNAVCWHKVGGATPSKIVQYQDWTPFQKMRYRKSNHNRFRLTMKTMSWRRNLVMVFWLLASIRGCLRQRLFYRARLLTAAYFEALFELPEILQWRRGSRDARVTTSEALIVRFVDPLNLRDPSNNTKYDLVDGVR